MFAWDMEHSPGSETANFLPGPETTCPGCGERGLQAVFNEWNTNYLCRLCRRCWRFEPGYVSELDPTTCPGCSQRHVCMARAEVARGAATWWG